VRARLGLALLCLAFAVAGGQPSAAQQGGEGSGERVRPPTELLEEYPFREGGRLRSRERSDEGQRTPTARTPRGDEESASESNAWGVIAPVILGAALVSLLGVLGFRAARRGADRGSAREPAAADRKRRPRRSPAARFPSRRRPTNTYAVVNQKGGVGKTTVSLTLGAAAVRRGRRVLLVDLDPQASATSVLGADREEGPKMSDVVVEGACALGEAVRPTEWGFNLAPADRELRRADTGATTGYETVLPQQLETVGEYDLMLIDCPPNLGTLTINALTASSHALVVTEPSFLALHAMEELLDTLRDVAGEGNPSLDLAGVVLNRVESTAEHKHSLAELERIFGAQLWEPHVPKRAILQDAMRRGVPPQDLQSHSHYATEIAEIFDALAVHIEAIKVTS
jgi:chromosome partitioning protein